MENVVSLFGSRGACQPKAGNVQGKATLENGYTKLSDQLIDALARAEYRLSGREYAIVFAVIRKTYGFQKGADWIALSQFEELTGVLKRDCCTLINGLVKKKILLRKANGHDQKLAINTAIEEWEKPKKTVRKSTNKSIKSTNKSIESTNKSIKSTNHNRDTEIQRNNKSSYVEESGDSATSECTEVSKTVIREGAAIQTPAGKKWGMPVDLEIAELIHEGVAKVTGDCNPNLADWANTIRLMREQKGRKPEHIKALFTFANQHVDEKFSWAEQILSPAALNRHWAKLAARRNGERNRLTQTVEPPKTQEQKLTDRSWADGPMISDGEGDC
ncbi:replication protein [Parendozoicomonas sp. Alg238-R29]|uniref:replication protein n=1 Tax=Parendozoicomonas sp. Alg238-R29 TaxID=2993446 RepID=UPI00248D8BA1|nr:replication protein [Parendozoicomonas sp. Alg238-R29]